MTGSSQWINHDLAPSPPERRTWTWVSMSMYWWSNAFNSNQWGNGAALIAVGLLWWQALLAAIIANVIASFVALGMGRPGATYHIGYPVLARGIFGMYGAYFFVALRAIVAIIWYGVQTFFGGKLLSVCLRCIFGHHWQNIPNHLPASTGTSSREILAFFLFWFIQFPFQFVHPTRIRHLFTTASVIVPIACFGTFGWCISYGGGLSLETLGSKPLTGGALGWAMLNGVNSVMGTLSPLLVNQPDFTRYTRSPRDAGWPQVASIFISKTVIFFLGCGATAAVTPKFGESYWNQWDLLSAILDRFWNPAARAGCFFAAFGFGLSVVTTNFGANSMPFGSDVTGLFPKFLTIKRGQVICSILGIAVVPWQLLKDAAGFLTFLGSYGIFMAPLCAIVICDYFVVRRGNYHVPSMYDPRPGGLYYGIRGWQIVPTACWVCGMVFGLPGLIGAYRPDLVAIAAIHMYNTGWVLTFGCAFVFYSVFGRFVFPPRIVPAGYAGLAGDNNNVRAASKFEELAKTDGFLDGECVEDLYRNMGVIDGQVVDAVDFEDVKAKMDRESKESV
ncbi:allantoin transporter [Trichodelitschia bisporula]|uniref:Allantoin transporter n=1 Tax=Trichodelitschia bisporula TaxID=703511 RepID=A0A6G1HWY7_9PEZI|nr:allantoin transporter [Trichodelitschia bisporula]